MDTTNAVLTSCSFLRLIFLKQNYLFLNLDYFLQMSFYLQYENQYLNFRNLTMSEAFSKT